MWWRNMKPVWTFFPFDGLEIDKGKRFRNELREAYRYRMPYDGAFYENPSKKVRISICGKGT